jgi:arylsulfatase A-like enzyme
LNASGWTPGGAIRKGDWKLIEFWEYDDVELYDLSQDIGDQNDLSKHYPEKVKELQLALQNWRTNTGAVMPVRAKE